MERTCKTQSQWERLFPMPISGTEVPLGPAYGVCLSPGDRARLPRDVPARMTPGSALSERIGGASKHCFTGALPPSRCFGLLGPVVPLGAGTLR